MTAVRLSMDESSIVSRRAAADLDFLGAGLAQVRIQEIGSALCGPTNHAGHARHWRRAADRTYCRCVRTVAMRGVCAGRVGRRHSRRCGDLVAGCRGALSNAGSIRHVLGAVLVLSASTDRLQRGHLAVVKQFVNEREIIVDHANWLNNGQDPLWARRCGIFRRTMIGPWCAFGIRRATAYGTRNYLVQGFHLS